MSETLYDLSDVMREAKFGRTKIYQMIADGEFPAPTKIGAASRWRKSDVDRWIASHFAESAPWSQGQGAPRHG